MLVRLVMRKEVVVVEVVLVKVEASARERG